MKDSASFEPKMLHSEQESPQKEPEKPWLRQRSEPAAWYMRFKRYLDLGPKRSLRKALAAEPMATKGDKNQSEPKRKISDVSVPGAWSRASKVWQWQERAAAYDLAQIEKQASQIRKMVSSAPYASRAYRVLKLDYLARVLMMQVKPGIELKWCLVVTSRLQSIMDDIAKEMQGLDGITLELCDASAMLTIRQEAIEEEYPKKIKSASDHEKLLAQFDRADALAKLEKQRL